MIKTSAEIWEDIKIQRRLRHFSEEERKELETAITNLMEGNKDELEAYRYLCKIMQEYPELQNYINSKFNMVYSEFLRASGMSEDGFKEMITKIERMETK